MTESSCKGMTSSRGIRHNWILKLNKLELTLLWVSDGSCVSLNRLNYPEGPLWVCHATRGHFGTQSGNSGKWRSNSCDLNLNQELSIMNKYWEKRSSCTEKKEIYLVTLKFRISMKWPVQWNINTCHLGKYSSSRVTLFPLVTIWNVLFMICKKLNHNILQRFFRYLEDAYDRLWGKIPTFKIAFPFFSP